MKKLFSILVLTILFVNNVYSYTNEELAAAEFLGYSGVIVSKDNASDYNLDSNISRKEMLKVMMNISGIKIEDKCEGKFSDLTDWGCKYGEIALKNGMLAPNPLFRPNDNVSKIEALKMIFKATGLEKEDNANWQVGYVNKSVEKGLIISAFTDYGAPATRGWIFLVAKNAILLNDNGEADILKLLFEDL